jgi:hypothetical protein
MRLLNTLSYKLEAFPEEHIPKYAILSHRWGIPEEEILLQDIGKPIAEYKKAYQKVKNACIQAQKDGHSHIWIDTCCIDKTSSAELSEAINSMYTWYRNSAVCYVYLLDFSIDGAQNSPESVGNFSQSDWFQRGWTLQELLAPSSVIFYDSTWTELGDKYGLCDIISEVTHIGRGYLQGSVPVFSASIAQRLSWAADRITTRPEDIAYCLMGIFSINMPLLYGEGSRAFLRLQEEIMKSSDDQSLFVWLDPKAERHDQYGLLASHPRFFKTSRNIVPTKERPEPYSMTNRGLRIMLPLRPILTRNTSTGETSLTEPSYWTYWTGQDFIGALNCIDLRWPSNSQRAIALMLRGQRSGETDFTRIHTGLVTTLFKPDIGAMSPSIIYVRQQPSTEIPGKTEIYALETETFLIEPDVTVRIPWPNDELPPELRFLQLIPFEQNAQTGLNKSFLINIPKAYAICAAIMVYTYQDSSKPLTRCILITIGSNFPPKLRLQATKGDIAAGDNCDNIAFDVIEMESSRLPDTLKMTKKLAKASYLPHTLGMTYFSDKISITVRKVAFKSNEIQSDPTLFNASVEFNPLGENCRRPVSATKWEVLPVPVTTFVQELYAESYSENFVSS